MESVSVRDGEGMKPSIATGKRDGLLGKIGFQNSTTLQGVCCPECGLVRLYASAE